MKDIDPMFWKILAVIIALAAVWLFVQWLLEQWWFIPLLIVIGIACVVAIWVWIRRRQ